MEDQDPLPSDVVITGISGRFPESDNMQEFQDHLFNGDDMVTEDDRRWEPGLMGLPKRSGKLRDLTSFDATFFNIHPKQANTMDAQVRLLLEVTYEAIVDAGINPEHIKGSRTGVFVGASGTDSSHVINNTEPILGYELTGTALFVFANRLSYFFDLQGPSLVVDTACSSGLLALDLAMKAIQEGQCEAAIVAASNICVSPNCTMLFQKLGMLSPGGACKTFDDSADGYVRSESVVAIYLQKVGCAKRIYATIVGSNTNSDGYTEQGIAFPSGASQRKLLVETYIEAGVEPAEVAYVEAHGTGTQAGDTQEASSIAQVFSANSTRRSAPLLIGSVKSNIGHTESASGLVSIAKVLIAMETGCIPPNIHYQTPNQAIPALSDGRLHVVDTRTEWPGGYVGINSFGVGGSNVHTILKSNKSRPSPVHPAAKKPRLFTFSARTHQGIGKAISVMQDNSESVELQSLLQANSVHPHITHPFRGYVVINADDAKATIEKCQGEQPPVWFIFSGMGSQWYGMGSELMCQAPFRNSISFCNAVLQPLGLDVLALLMNSNETTFEETLNCSVGIVTIQIALVDTLRVLGIEPDGILGHSIGELGCAYADGCLTLEETVLTAYWRGRSIQEAHLTRGAMAAVGLDWKEAQMQCPDGVVVACHNAPGTVTISGPETKVFHFEEDLLKRDVFVRRVGNAGVAYHSPCMTVVEPALKRALDKIILQPKARSKKWISSTVRCDQWESDLAKYASPDYFVANLLNPVLFQEAQEYIPKGAVIIEIGPHCLLQAIIRRSLGTDVVSVGLMKRHQPNALEFMLNNLGKIHNGGVNFDPLALYEPVKYPVSRGTPMISPLLSWDHTVSWRVPAAHEFLGICSGNNKHAYSFEMELGTDADHGYLREHVLDGRALFPATGHLVLVWKAFARMHGKQYDQMPIEFRDVRILQAIMLTNTDTVRLDVNITGTGFFVICDEKAAVVSIGHVRLGEDGHVDKAYMIPTPPEINSSSVISFTLNDVYQDLWLRGYEYGPAFKVINTVTSDGDHTFGQLLWKDDWVTFLDGFLQLALQGMHNGRMLKMPTRIHSVIIDPQLHVQTIVQEGSKQVVNIKQTVTMRKGTTGGVTVSGVHFTATNLRPIEPPPVSLQEGHFLPLHQAEIFAGEAELATYRETCEMYAVNGLKKVSTYAVANEHGHPSLVKIICTKKSIATHNADEVVVQQLMESPRASLVKMLQVVFAQEQNGSFREKARSIVQLHHRDLMDDKLLRCFCEERVLRPCIDIAYENCLSTDFRVFEYAASRGQMFRSMFSITASNPTMCLKYLALDKPGSPCLIEYAEMGIETMQWDMDQPALASLPCVADLVTCCNLSMAESNLDKSLSALSMLIRDNGFVLLCEPTRNFTIPLLLHGLADNMFPIKDQQYRTEGPFCDEEAWKHNIEQAGLRLVAQRSDGQLYTVFLCRKVNEQPLSNPVIISVDGPGYSWVEDVKAAISTMTYDIWLKANSNSVSGVVGMVHSLRRETGDRVRCLLNNGTGELENDATEIMMHKLAINVYRNDKWGTFRHFSIPTGGKSDNVTAEHAYVRSRLKGDLSSLEWVESPTQHHASQSHELCSVYYAALNFRDIMVASGNLPTDALPDYLDGEDSVLGMEFSGRNQEGLRIFGVTTHKALATTVVVDANCVWPVPERWTLEEAATVPLAYSTAYYALVVRGRIRQGQRVLIHSGSGGVGQAAIRLALHYGCQVYTTVGSTEKRTYLKELFPELRDDGFASSRNADFEEHFMRVTQGKGMNVVLNALAGEMLFASLRLLAKHGHFLEIGKADLSKNTDLGMSVFLRNVTFHGILLDALLTQEDTEWPTVANLVLQGIQQGVVRPLDRTVFNAEQVQDAFRYMTHGKHKGKVIVKIREEEPNKVIAPRVQIPVQRQSMCHPGRSYIIVGGLGGFGLALADWLAQNGARHLVLTSRSGVSTGFQELSLQTLRQDGVIIRVCTLNVVKEDQTRKLIAEASDVAPVGGVFNLGMVLHDGGFETQTTDSFREAGGVKVAGTQNLDVVTRQACSSTLRWFVVFSSFRTSHETTGLGLTSYAYANSAMERICERRKRDGFPALAIQWGPVADVGVVFNKMGGNTTIIGGCLPQRITSCLKQLGRFLCQDHPVVSSKVPVLKESAAVFSEEPNSSMLTVIAHILGISDVSSINPELTLIELGLDSLMSVEVKQALESYNLPLSNMAEIRQLSINQLLALSADSNTSK